MLLNQKNRLAAMLVSEVNFLGFEFFTDKLFHFMQYIYLSYLKRE